MSLRDFRKLIEVVDAVPAYVGVEVVDPSARKPVRLDVNLDGRGIVLTLDEGEAGELFDAIAQALREVVTGRATGRLRADTPETSRPASEPSASIPDRG